MKIGVPLLALLAASTAWAAPLVKLGVAPPQGERVIGDPIEVQVTIENDSPRPFVFASMQPYEIKTTDSAGRRVYNPTSEPVVFSGIFSETRINPSESKTFGVSLADYADFERAGAYHVELKISQGGERGWPEYPSAELGLKLRMPTDEEAKAMVAKQAEHHGGYRRFTRPVFLEPLRAVALQGQDQAVYAIGRIPTTAASLTLIEIAASAKPREARAALAVLQDRTPHDRPDQVLTHLLDQAPGGLWDEHCRAEARQLARQFLNGSDSAFRVGAAQLLAKFGDRADVAPLLALTRAGLEQPRPGAMGAIVTANALLALRDRGFVHQGDPTAEPVWAYLYFLPMRPTPPSRPPGWKEQVFRWVGSSSPVLREAAIRSIPFPPPGEFAELLKKAKNDPNHGVRAAVLFVTKHEIEIPYQFTIGHGPKLPPVTLQLEKGISPQADHEWQVAAYSAAIAQCPKNADAYDNRGLAKYDLGRFDDAMADFDQAIKLRPRLAAAYNNRGLVRAAKKDPVGALADYNQALVLDPKMQEALFNRGRLYASQRKFAEAVADYSEVIEMNLNFAPGYGYRAQAERQLGDAQAAAADRKQATALDPNWWKTRAAERVQAGG